MKVPKLSVAAIGFAILVIAMDFAVIRAVFFGLGTDGWAKPGAPILPHRLADPIFGSGPKGWAVFAFFLLPMIDALLIGAYRLRRRGGHTAGTVGFIIAGSVATLAVFTSCLMSPGRAIGLSMPISRRIALASFQGLARLVGHGELLYRGPSEWTYGVRALEWTYAVIFAVLIPIAFFCILPLIAAIIGGRVARRFGPGAPIGAGFGETNGGIKATDMAMQQTRLSAGRGYWALAVRALRQERRGGH